MDKEIKLVKISQHFEEIMEILGLDLENESLKDTPDRVAKMFVNEIFMGLDKENEPKITLFNNTSGYNQMIIQRDITVWSTCEHHFMPFFGVAHIGYIPKHNEEESAKVIGLSKLNRMVDYISRKPQIQERLTSEICNFVKNKANTDDVAVLVECMHTCVSARGIKDCSSRMITSKLSGAFNQQEVREEFMSLIKS